MRGCMVMLTAMQMMFDALWRALADCLRPRVIAWSVFPLLLVAGLAALFGVLWWEGAVNTLQLWLEHASWLQWLWHWMGAASTSATAIVAAITVVLVVSPVIIMVALAIIGVVMTPQMVALVAERRFALLERKRGASWWGSAVWALASTGVALLALLLSIPLWFVPLLVLVVPPLIWGWLTYRVMAFDALAEHASQAERRVLFKTHRYRLILMGVICGFLGAAPGVVWASGLVFATAFWLLIPLALWIYALVFALSSLWFAHYGLAALYSLRAAAGDVGAVTAPSSGPVDRA